MIWGSGELRVGPINLQSESGTSSGLFLVATSLLQSYNPDTGHNINNENNLAIDHNNNSNPTADHKTPAVSIILGNTWQVCTFIQP